MNTQNTFVIERVFDFPVALVWKAWTDCKMLKQWWGPNNVIIPECEIDLRVGRKFYIVMEADEGMGPYQGTRWPMRGEFVVIEPNSQLSYDAKAWTEGQKEESMIEQTTELIFKEEDGKTKVKVKAVVYRTGPLAGMAVEGMKGGFTEQLEKLDVFLKATK